MTSKNFDSHLAAVRLSVAKPLSLHDKTRKDISPTTLNSRTTPISIVETEKIQLTQALFVSTNFVQFIVSRLPLDWTNDKHQLSIE